MADILKVVYAKLLLVCFNHACTFSKNLQFCFVFYHLFW
uniref:Uncharacterized protein n=1 Tax=Rhizophora mucronata TaxID=61149 RepID=A0A2P2QXN9_RHIMU